MDSVKLQIDVNNIKIDPAQLKKITQMNASFDSLLKVVNSINAALSGMNTKTTTFLKNSTQLSGIYDKLAGSVKTADSAMDSVNRKAQLLRENSKLTAANFKAMGDNAAKAGKIPTPKPTAALPGTSPTGGGGSSPTAGIDPRGVVQTAFAFNQVFSAVTAATGALNQFLQPYVELDKQVKNIGTLGRANFEEFTEYASKLAAEVPGQANDAAAAYYQIISALGTRAESFTNQQIAQIGEIAAKAAVAGQTTTQVAADVGTSILNAYGMKAEETGKIFDTLFAGIKLGKCVLGSTRVLGADGSYNKIEEMSGSNEIVSFDGNEFKPMNSEWIYQGKKQTVRLKTNLGREIVTTWNHPYLTKNGWLKVKDLSVGEKIAVPKEIPYFGIKEVPEHIAEFLGFWLAEGSRKSSSPSITTNKYRYKVKEWADKFGCIAKQMEKREGKAKSYRFIANDKQGNQNKGKNPVVNLLREYGLFDIDNKFIPEQIYTWNKKSIQIFLRWFFNGDGWLCDLRNSGNSGFQLGYSAKNKEFAESINHLLLRFGVVGRLRYRKQVDCYDWSTNRYSEIKIFIDSIGIDRDDLELFNQYTPQHQSKLNDTILYDKIVEIEATGKDEKVYDLTVPILHNFVANDIIAHNTTFEEIAGALPNFTSAASNAGVGVDQTTAALASLTAIGTPTAMAGTQLNAMFTLLSKGNANLESALAASGLTLDDLRNQMKAPVEEGGGLVNVLQTMRTAVEATGEAFGAKFTGRVEAANLVMGLTGQNLQIAKDTYAALENEVAGGAAAKAFGVAATSIYAQTDSILSTIQNKFNTLFSTIGSGSVTALNSFVQLAPAVTGLSSALAIVPVKGIFSSNFVTKTLPKALAGVLGMIPAFGGLTAAQTAAGVAGGSMWATILWPITLVVAAIAAIVGVVVLVMKYFDQLKAVVFGVFNGIKTVIQDFIQNWVDTIEAIKNGDFKKAIIGVFKGTVGVYAEAGKSMVKGTTEGINKSLDSNANIIQKRFAKTFAAMDNIEVKVKATADLDNLIKNYETTVNQISELKATPNLTEEQEQQLARLEEKAQLAANAIADIAPDSISSSKSTIDENGKLIESYEVSIDKAKDFKNKQEELNKADVSEATKQYEKDATNLLGIYETQTKEVDALIKKRDELASSGDLKGAKEMEDDITEAVKKQKASKDLVIKGYKESIEIGGEELGVNKKIQSEFKITEGTVQDIKNAQQGVNEELTSSAKLATLFGEGMSAAKTAQDEQAAALAKLIKSRNEGNTTDENGLDINKAINNQLSDTLKAKKTLSEFDKAKAEADKLAGLGAKATTKQTKSLYDNLQKVYDAEVSRLDIQQQSNELDAEATRLAQGRESNAIDDLALKEQENNKLLEQKKILIDLYNITPDGKDVGVRLKQEDKEKVLQDYEQLQLDIRKNANEQSAIQMKLEIDDKKAQEVLENRARTDLEFQIEIGAVDETELINLIAKQSDAVYNKIADLNQKLAEQKEALTKAETQEQKDSINATILEYTNQYDSLMVIYQDKKNEIIKMEIEISANTLIEINKRLDAEKTAKQAQLDLDIETAKKRQEILNGTYTNAIAKKNEKELAELESGEQAKLDVIDAAEQEKIDILENQKELGILSETLYQQRLTEIQTSAESERIAQTEAAAKKKAEAEANARTQSIIAEGLNQGVLLEASRQFEIQKSQIEADAAQKKLEALIASGTASKAEIAAAQENFDTLNKIVKDKGDLLLQYSGVIQDGLSKTIGELFAGDADAAKDAFKEVLAVVAGGLEKMAAAAVTQLILGQIWKTAPTTGLAGLVLVPAIKAISNAAVSALIRPVTQSLLSFANGGQIDKPTMAVIGDAKNGNSSTEWVFNNKNLKQYSAMVAKDYAKSMEQKNDTANMARLVSEAYKLANSKVLIETIRKDKESNKNVSDARINELVQSNMEIKKVLLDANEQRNMTNDYTNATNRLLLNKDFSNKIENNYISGSTPRKRKRRIY